MRGRNKCTSPGDVSGSVDEKHILGENWPERSLSWWFSGDCSLPCPHLMNTDVIDFGSHDRRIICVSQASGTQHIPDFLKPRLRRFLGAVGHPLTSGFSSALRSSGEGDSSR